MLKNPLYCKMGKYWILLKKHQVSTHFWVQLSSNESDSSLKDNELDHVKVVISIFRYLVLPAI